MGLFGTLISSTSALRVFEQALEVTQNNVSNASTPGFARQRLRVESMPFDPDRGLPGGVLSAGPESYRDDFAERAVWRRQEAYGFSDQSAGQLSRIEAYFDVTGTTGIPRALSGFFQSISAWSVAPNDMASRTAVIEQAGDLAAGVRNTASGLIGAEALAEQNIRQTVDTINHLAGEVRELNLQARQDARTATDPSVDTRLHAVLEELAEYADVTALKQPDSAWTLLLGGQTPLVIGERQYQITTDRTGTQAVIVDASGRDVTAQASNGRLGALLQYRNTTLPGLLSGLDRLAATVADRVNSLLAAGVDQSNQPGAALFTYSSSQGAAASLRVTSIAPEQLAAALPSAPGGNGNALNLVELADSGEIDGSSFTEYYAALARSVGRALETARDDLSTNEQLLIQARELRHEISGVSLDEEAIRLIEFQRAYQASARLVTILSDLTEETLNMIG